MRRKKKEAFDREPVKRIYADPNIGLTEYEARLRLEKGWGNSGVAPPTKTASQIVAANLFTYFNLVFFLLAACVIFVGAFRDLLFMPVVIINTAIGIVQELRSKKTLDRLTLLTAPKARIIREGREAILNTEETVLDDIAIFSSGNQIYADAIVIDGSVQVNEALITGESDEITKKPGDLLLSGSFVVSGSCRARLERVGRDSYVSKLTLEAKKMKKGRHQSEMMRSLTRLVQIIGLVIIPIGLLLFYNQFYILGLPLRQSVVHTVGAMVGMIPEGLYLLTTIALAVGVIRLAQNKTLVHDLGCIETLARVDVLCVDKTGTITEPKMEVEETVLLCPDRFNEDDIKHVMLDYVYNMSPDNETMIALREHFKGNAGRIPEKTLPFTSSLKYSGLMYPEGEGYLLGAPEMILGIDYAKYSEQIEPYSREGYRVLLLTLYDGDVTEPVDPSLAMPLALILLSNKIRAEAPATFRFFAKQGVSIKVISGDNPVTVSNIARKAGIEGAENYVDATTLNTDRKLRAAATKYTVFGRVRPDQKKRLVQALKAAGHKVAMTGDGVNDVLALKEADCSIAMASGSEVATRVSQLVLLDSNFASMPYVVMEGRRVINNIERAASLFLVKNIFSFLLAIISMIAVLPYPVTAAQLSLVSTLTIGVPSFFLAMEPNTEIVKGRFLRNVIFRALPAGLTNVILVIGVMLFSMAFDLTHNELSTISAIVLAEVGLIMLYCTCRPWSTIRKLLWGAMCFAIIMCVLFFKELFALSPLDFGSRLVLVTLGLVAPPIIRTISDILEFINRKINENREAVKRRTLI
jgi:cation-transporting ATPase E